MYNANLDKIRTKLKIYTRIYFYSNVVITFWHKIVILSVCNFIDKYY